MLLAIGGALAGLIVAMAAARLLLSLAFAGATMLPIDTTPSPLVLGFAAGLALMTGLLFGAAPAWLATRKAPAPVPALFEVALPDSVTLRAGGGRRLSLSPDGTLLVIVAGRAGKKGPNVRRVDGAGPGTCPQPPRQGQLKAGDFLVSCGGANASAAAAIRAAVQRVTVGDAVDVVVTRDGAKVTAKPSTRQASDGRTILGIVLTPTYKLPFPVKIDAGNVGGPSAGLMFSLVIYDKLTEGAMTGGAKIAGTGTIDDSGKVGPIGGIRQKVVGAQHAGATFFLAPEANCAELAGKVPEGILSLINI